MSAPALVLNRNYQPVNTISAMEAIKKVFIENAVVVLPPNSECKYWQELSWDDWSQIIPKEGDKTIASPNQIFRLPEIIRLSDYDKMPSRQVKLSRRAIHRRDNNTCQYCEVKLSSEDLTIDHVWPKYLGGKTEWCNVVVACVDCNRKKANRPLASDKRAKGYAKVCYMTLKRDPKIPKYDPLRGRDIRVDSWQHFLGDMYWNVTLKD